jgi:hypothetical protein
MNSNIDNSADKLLKKAIGAITPDSPGEGFVLSVMQRVQQAGLQPVRKAEPLISWKGWIFIGLIAAGMFSMVIFTDTSGFKFDTIRDYYRHFATNYLSVFLSRFFVAGMMILALLFMIQIRLVLSRFERMQNAGHEG